MNLRPPVPLEAILKGADKMDLLPARLPEVSCARYDRRYVNLCLTSRRALGSARVVMCELCYFE